MEISSSPPLTDLQRDNLFNFHSQEVEELHYPEFHGLEEATERGDRKRDGDECDYLVFEIGKDRGGLSEKVHDTGRGTEKEEEGGRGETEGEDEGRGEIEGEEGRGEIEGEVEETRDIKIKDNDRGQIEGEDRHEEEIEDKDWGRREIEGEDEGQQKIEGGDGESGETEGGMKEDALSEFLLVSGGPLLPSSPEPLTVAAEEPVAMSQDAWTTGNDLGNRDDLSEGHLSDCLQAELAVVYSDSDAGDDQWAAFTATEAATQEQTCARGRKEDEKGEEDEQRREEESGVEEESGGAEQREEETEARMGGQNDDEDDEELMRRRELFLRSPSASSTASSTDPDRRVGPFVFYL